MKPSARHAFIEAEATTAIAHQIRILRQQRGLSQAQLAKLMNTTQAGISRLEDSSYGKCTLSTLVALAKVFDTGLQVRFVSLLDQFRETRLVKKTKLEVEPFVQEADLVAFADDDVTPMFIESLSSSESEVRFIAQGFICARTLVTPTLVDGTGGDFTAPLEFSKPNKTRLSFASRAKVVA